MAIGVLVFASSNEPGLEIAQALTQRSRRADPLVAKFASWQLDGTRFVTPRAEVAPTVLSKRATVLLEVNARAAGL